MPAPTDLLAHHTSVSRSSSLLPFSQPPQFVFIRICWRGGTEAVPLLSLDELAASEGDTVSSDTHILVHIITLRGLIDLLANEINHLSRNTSLTIKADDVTLFSPTNDKTFRNAIRYALRHSLTPGGINNGLFIDKPSCSSDRSLPSP